MILRAATGSVYVGLIVFCVLMGVDWFFGLIALFIVVAMLEMQNLLNYRAHLNFFIRIFDILAGIDMLIFLGSCFGFNLTDIIIFISSGLLFILYIPIRIILAVFDKSEKPAKSFIFSILSLAYISFPLSMLALAYNFNGKELVLATFCFIWLNDTGAYLSGISLGKNKLCERLSPKKTWEGFCGGLLLAIAAGWGTAYILNVEYLHLYIIWMAYAALVGILSTFGDLFESLIKRTLGVKDSGRIIPGHGGILDRIDSLLAVSPIALIFSLLLFYDIFN